MTESGLRAEVRQSDARALLAPAAAPAGRTGHYSVVKLPKQWFVVATSRELGARPIARTLMGTPLVLFRGANGAPAALLDRCPHRNVPLSAGRTVGGEIECAYHGWRFDGSGACRHVPSLLGDAGGKAREAPMFAAMEQDGFVWVYSSPDAIPEREPYRFHLARAKGYTTVTQAVFAESTLHAALENALDVPHTQFLHRGLFRSKSRGIEITAKVRRTGDRVEAEYLGEPRPPGLVAKLLSPSGGMVTHFDRFVLPSVAEVEYRIGTENHILVASVMTPETDFLTRIWAVVSFRLRLIPGWLVKPLLKPLALKIFRQDSAILKMQAANVRRFGGESFAWTEIDVLGRHIWRLLRGAERGDPLAAEAHEESVKLVV